MAPGSSESSEIVGVPIAHLQNRVQKGKKGLQCDQVWQTRLERSQLKGVLVISGQKTWSQMPSLIPPAVQSYTSHLPSLSLVSLFLKCNTQS